MNIKEHPCFNGEAKHRYGRVHLPVAPKCNIQCNFCNKKYDCVSESRPGVTSQVLTPGQAFTYLGDLLKLKPNIKVVGIAGPGDPFANPLETMETLRMVRKYYPDMLLCVATNGLEITPFIDELVDLKVSHVTLTVNAIDLEVGKGIYSWVRYGKRIYRGESAAAKLLENQQRALKRLVKTDIITKVNTVVIPGINDAHLDTLGNYFMTSGVDLQNCMAFRAVKGANFEDREEPTALEIRDIQKKAAGYVKQMKHCQQCRADAAGLVTDSCGSGPPLDLEKYAKIHVMPDSKRPYVAAVSNEGMLVNQHLGEAEEFLIYEVDEDGKALLKEKRQAPLPGGGNSRWMKVAETLFDCKSLLVNDAGNAPESILNSSGIKMLRMEGLLDDIVPLIFKDDNIIPYMKKNRSSCGTDCSGNGMGCG